MHILALNTYHGGSHQAFFENWQANSEHRWTTLTLPAHHWKWRMRHAAITFAEQLEDHTNSHFDILLCTDMLNLAEFTGLAPPAIQALPNVIYFHENQLMYPDVHATERDFHFAFINFTSMLAANQVWFNSQWHFDNFYEALKRWLAKMPDFYPKHAIQLLTKKCIVQPPGIKNSFIPTPSATEEDSSVIKILWAARWEHDKNPQCFFAALTALKQQGVNFRLSVIGAHSQKTPDVFNHAEKFFAEHIDHWGYADSEESYRAILQSSDIIVSTAHHEFFGIAVLEAVACGCIPLVPDGLAYPETLHLFKQQCEHCFYDGSADSLAQRLAFFAEEKMQKNIDLKYMHLGKQTVEHLDWTTRGKEMDQALLQLIQSKPNPEQSTA
jgi:glycosyltransferase involved in cell wall biosynthesis